MPKFWGGPIPSTCNSCHADLTDTFVDGATTVGPWMVLCPSCHSQVGVGLGIGRGQKYRKCPVLDSVGLPRWEKVAG